MKIYVINKNGKPLMPCSPTVARLLLKQKRAKCISREPFIIKLNYLTTEYTQPLTLGVDTGSSKIGAAVTTEYGDVLYISEVEVRNDISRKMKQRAQYRRTRRSRKCRYRPCRFLNRRNSIRKDRFSPTMRSKLDSHLNEIKYIKSILPISNIILETATFDPHALMNPKVLEDKSLYQNGINYGFANTKAYVKNRDNYVCQNCKGKSKDCHLHVHHIEFRSNGGSDKQDNLLTLCETCHKKVHNGSIVIQNTGKKRSNLNHATQMNSIRKQLLARVESIETFGFITTEHRQLLNLPKEHYIDAVVIATEGLSPQFKVENVLVKKCISSGDYQQNKGIRSEKAIPTGKIHGFRKFDKVWYNGSEYFIKGKMSTGYAFLMDIDGTTIKLYPMPKFSLMKRLTARKSWITAPKIIANTY